MYTSSSPENGNWLTRIFSLDLAEGTLLPYAFAGNDTVVRDIIFFETRGEAENYSSISWTTSGDGNFITNNAEHVIYLRGPGDIDSGQVTLSMHLTGYYPETEASDSMILYLQPVGTGELIENKQEITLYPNPVKDRLTLRARVPEHTPVTFEVVSNDGKVIFTGKYTLNNEQFNTELDFSYLPEGIYFYRLTTNDQPPTTQSGKILVDH